MTTHLQHSEAPAPVKPQIEHADHPGVPVETLEFDSAVKLAVNLHEFGFLDAAETLYQRILEAAPQHANILQFSAVLMHQRGNSEAALERIRQAIELEPKAAGFWNNLGNILLSLRRFDEAAAAYTRCSELSPEDPGLHNNLGLLYRAQGRKEEAEAAFQRAIALRPDFIDGLNNYGNLLRETGRMAEAIQLYCRATTLYPKHPETRRLMALSHVILGEVDKAKELYRAWLEEEPDNPLARHYLAACSGDGVPQRASDAYVEMTFDRFAESFDAKLEQLLYRAPQLVADEVADLYAGRVDKSLDVLDAGCGTGLCGPLLAPYARQLIGVDLSGEMIERARPRKAYDVLHKAELTAFLADHPHAYDLVVSADTLCYFGALEGVATAALDALRPDGWLVFTVEQTGGVPHPIAEDSPSRDRPPPSRGDLPASDGPPHVLQANGRYAHRRSYLETVFKNVGFAVVQAKDVHLRLEGGRPVEGLLVSCRKAGGATPADRS
jgi:predicted TPR repeat methyltransferase